MSKAVSPAILAAILLGSLLIYVKWGEKRAQMKGKPVVRVTIRDDNPYHVFRPGESFTVEVVLELVSGEPPANISCQWRDYTGRPLSKLIPLRLGRNLVHSPGKVEVGYYGLVLLPQEVKFLPLREYGFAVLPEAAAKAPDPSSPFGVVHMEVEDPYLGATWVKTLTDLQFSSPHQWRREMEYRLLNGKIEIPLVIGGPWKCDNTRPISGEQLDRLYEYLVTLFSADPKVPVWELGLEENLAWRRNKSKWRYYWQNLAAKLRVAREAREAVNSSIRIAYQIAEFDFEALRTFFESGVAEAVDVLSLHPYRWPNFEDPEEWHDAFIERVRKLMREYGRMLPIWYTEVGAPQNDMGVPQMYSDGHPVRGLTRREEVAYLVKLHVLALRAGIEKVIWYNYRDRGTNATDVEDHFGLRDYWGFPKPAYVAYAVMVRCISGKKYVRTVEVAGVVKAHVFAGVGEKCIVAWTYPPKSARVKVSKLGVAPPEVKKVVNAVGTPLPMEGDEILLTQDPIYIIAENNEARSSSHDA